MASTGLRVRDLSAGTRFPQVGRPGCRIGRWYADRFPGRLLTCPSDWSPSVNFRIADDTASDTDTGFECFSSTGVITVGDNVLNYWLGSEAGFLP
jgi:hypothetical protein